jgi:hypothetical protein
MGPMCTGDDLYFLFYSIQTVPNSTFNSSFFFFFSFLGWGETVHLGRRPLTGLLYQPRMIDDACGSSRWNENWLGKPKGSEKTCLSCILSTTNPTWPDLGTNPCRRGGKQATNPLSSGTTTINTNSDLLYHNDKMQWRYESVVIEFCCSHSTPKTLFE